MATFNSLREANVARSEEWGEGQHFDLSFRAIEFAGEAGEVCNVVKKLIRERMGVRGSRATLEDLAKELADARICLELLAQEAGIDLDKATEAKFNETSEKMNLQTRLKWT